MSFARGPSHTNDEKYYALAHPQSFSGEKHRFCNVSTGAEEHFKKNQLKDLFNFHPGKKNSKTLEIPPILSTREVSNHTPSSIKMGATNSQRTSASFKSGMSNCSMTWLGTRPFHTCFTCSDVARWIGQPCLGAGAVVWGWTARKIPHRVYQFIRVHQSLLQQNQAKLRVSRVQPPQPPCSSC